MQLAAGKRAEKSSRVLLSESAGADTTFEGGLGSRICNYFGQLGHNITGVVPFSPSC